MVHTHCDNSYLLSKFCFQEAAAIADKCDGRRLNVASCSTSHSYTVKDNVMALAHPDDSTEYWDLSHICAAVSHSHCIEIPVSPSALCQCRGFCHPNSSTDRKWTGVDSLTTTVLTVRSGLSGQPHFGSPNSKGKLMSPALMLSHRHSCSPEGLCLHGMASKYIYIYSLKCHPCNRWCDKLKFWRENKIKHSCKNKQRFVLLFPHSSHQAALALRTTQLTFPLAPLLRFLSQEQMVLNHISSPWNLQKTRTNTCHNYTGTSKDKWI